MLAIESATALWFLPFVAPICLYVAWSDMAAMKIYNTSVMALAAVFVVVGLIALPLDVWGWRLVTMVVVLVIGIVANAIGLMGAGDAKFIAAAAPFVDPGDALTLVFLFAGILLASFIAHRLARVSPLRRLVPQWESWERTREFPMGLALGPTLAAYLALGVAYGA